MAPALAGLLLAGCGGKTSRQASDATGGPFHEIASPAGLGSGVPHLASAPGSRLGMSWLEARSEGGHRLLWSALEGDAWTPPATVAEGDSFFVNWADFPSFVSSDGAIYAHWLWKNGRGTYAYEVRVSVSLDGGTRWSAPVVVHDDGTATEHGFVSMIGAKGSAMLVWLDGRATEGHGEDDPLRSMHLRAATIGPDLRVREAALLDDRVCDCCQTDLVATPHGALAAYRDRSQEEVRDISLVRWNGGSWSAPEEATRDGWEIAGCPVNGPALDASGERVVLAWFTQAQDTARVLAALSADGGRTFSTPERIDEGDPLGRVDAVSVSDGTALVSWLEKTSEGAEIRVRRLGGGEPGEVVAVSPTSPARRSGFPRLARAGDAVYAAWTDVSDSSRVRVAAADSKRLAPG